MAYRLEFQPGERYFLVLAEGESPDAVTPLARISLIVEGWYSVFDLNWKQLFDGSAFPTPDAALARFASAHAGPAVA